MAEMSSREQDRAREAWLRDNVPRSQLSRRPQYVEPAAEWTSMTLHRQRRPPAAVRNTSEAASPVQPWDSQFPPRREHEHPVDSMLLGGRPRNFTPPEPGVVPSSRPRSVTVGTVIRRKATSKDSDSDLETIKGPPMMRRSEDTHNQSPGPKIRHATFTETPQATHSKSSSPSDKPHRPKTPYPSIKKSKSTPAFSTFRRTRLRVTPDLSIDSKDSKDSRSKGNTLKKAFRPKTLYPPKASEIKAAFNTLRNGRNPPKTLASDIKSVFNTLRAGTLRPPKEAVSETKLTSNILQPGNLAPPKQQASDSKAALRNSIPSNPSTSTKSTRPLTPHPESAQAHTLPRHTTIRLSGTRTACKLAASLSQDATAPIDDSTLRVRNTVTAHEDHTEQQHLPAPPLHGTANDHHSAVSSLFRRSGTPFAEPYGCNTLNGMPAFFEHTDTNNFNAITASHRRSDYSIIDVHGLPCGHRSIRLDPMEPQYALVFNSRGSVCARIFVGEGQLVAYKNCPFVYIENGGGRRERVDVSCSGTLVLDEVQGLVKEAEGVEDWYEQYVDPHETEQNPEGLMKRGWKVCKSWMGTVKGTMKKPFKGTMRIKGDKRD